MPETHRCNEIEKELYEFKERYANNGKEITRLAMALENIIKEVQDHRRFSEEDKRRREEQEKEFRKELEPILNSYNALLTGRKWVIGTVAFLFTMGSFYLLIRQIFHK